MATPLPFRTTLIRAFLVWCLIAVAEVGQGILRVSFLVKRLGDHRSRQVGVFTGCCLIFAIVRFHIHWMFGTAPGGPAVASTSDCLVVGVFLMALMVTFDVLFGRFVFLASWSRIASDFDPRKGNLLLFGMIFLAFAPLLASRHAAAPPSSWSTSVASLIAGGGEGGSSAKEL